jgi:EmrB/QacA subfamily drug resistance transporter
VSQSPENGYSDSATRRSVFLAATLASFLTPFMGSAVNVALPAIARSLTLDAVAMSWVATSYILAAAVALVPAGRIADLRGRKKVFLLGMLVFTATSFCCAMATTAMQLITFRVMQGIGGAMMMGTGMAIVTSVFPPGDRGRILGYNVSAVYLGLSLGPFIGGILTDRFGWESVFLVNVPLGLLAITYTLIRMKGEWLGTAGGRFDLAGAVLYGAALLGMMYGFSQITKPVGVYILAAGIVLLAAFVFWEIRSGSPVLDLRLLIANRVFALSNLAAFINYSATFGVTFLLSMYLQYVKGFDAKTSGFILVAQPVVMALLSPVAGRLSDKIEPRIVASVGMGLTTIGLGLLGFLAEGTSVEMIVGSLIVLGAGFALFSSPNTNAVMSSVNPVQYGTASAFSGTMRLVGQVFSMGIVSLFISLHMGSIAVGPSAHGPLIAVERTAFLVFTLMSAGGIFASLARGKVRAASPVTPSPGQRRS